jgi:LPS-assembly protein
MEKRDNKKAGIKDIIRELFSFLCPLLPSGLFSPSGLLTCSGLLMLATFTLIQPVRAETFQANGWYCQALENGQWDCGAASRTPAVKILQEEGTISPQTVSPQTAPYTSLKAATADIKAGTKTGGTTEETRVEISTTSAVASEPSPGPVVTSEPSVNKTDPLPVVNTPQQAIETNVFSAEASPLPALTSDDAFPEPHFDTPEEPTGGMAFAQPVLSQGAVVMPDIWSNCTIQPQQHLDKKSMSEHVDDSTNVEADEAHVPSSDQIEFEGNVVITRGVQALTADKALYNKTNSTFDAQGNVIISEPNMVLKGDTARYQSDVRKGRLDNASYELPSRPAQGVADNINFKPGEIELGKPTYSTCPAGDQDWVLKASSLQLHTDEGYGEGKHAILKFKGVPIAYTPYIRFPLTDERESGFLLPTIGSSSRSGFELATPYYFNIAPDQDATVTPRILSDRGLMLGGQYRYLSENHSGEVYGEWLNDSIYDESREVVDVAAREDVRGEVPVDGKLVPRTIPENRGAFSLQQRANWRNGWSGLVDYNYVSDNYYLEDFGSNIRDKSETQLLRQGVLNYKGNVFNFMARAQGYQQLRSFTHIYSRLPQLVLTANKGFEFYGADINTGLSTDLTLFASNWDDFLKDRVESTRYQLRPYVSMPFRNSYSFVIPKVSLDMVGYKLSNEDKDPRADLFDDNSPSRVAPIVSLDSGLFFDRELTLFNLPMQQTLEPRLYYLYVPDKDQSNIPLFDTGRSTFSFSQLFRENRFNGHDRLGDANQLTAALTTRFIDSHSGAERFIASIGQIYYFEDREVTLLYDKDGQPIQLPEDTQYGSSIAAELSSQFARNWYTSFTMLYNPYDGGQVDESRYRLQFKSDRYHIANFDYLYRVDDYKQIDVSSYWKIAPRWRALARWNYSFYDQATLGEENKNKGYTLEALLGVEYDSCCYALRLVVGREQDSYHSEADNRIMLQLQLKGLGSVGNISGRSLAQDIPGFEPLQY